MDFKKIYEINVNEHIEQKNGLNYLSWAFAWAEIKKECPDATYKIFKNEQGLPYLYDEKTGYMVFTEVTIDNETHEMWLPVMDGSNKAMKSSMYTYSVKDWDESKAQGRYVSKEKTVESATMFDINKTIMRCLVKNLAMFGLGLYIYAGEDLPENDESGVKIKQTSNKSNKKSNIQKVPDDQKQWLDPKNDNFQEAIKLFHEGNDMRSLRNRWKISKANAEIIENSIKPLPEEANTTKKAPAQDTPIVVRFKKLVGKEDWDKFKKILIEDSKYKGITLLEKMQKNASHLEVELEKNREDFFNVLPF